MPNYKYSAIGTDGRTVSGRLDASNKTECVAELRKRNLTPIDIQEKGGGSGRQRRFHDHGHLLRKACR